GRYLTLRVAILGLVVALAGCVGGVVLYDQTSSEPNVGPSTKSGRLARYHAPDTAPFARKVAIRQAWGEPVSIKSSGGNERWIYSLDDRLLAGRRWNGLLLFSYVPVPLAIPVGREYVVLEFTGDELSHIETFNTGAMGGFCIVAPGGP